MRAPALRAPGRRSFGPEPRTASQPKALVPGAALQLAPLPDPEAADPLPAYDRPAQSLLEEASENGRAYRIEIRPSMSEGQYMGLALRMWGEGHWCCRDGQAHYHTKREHARLEALRWLESGR